MLVNFYKKIIDKALIMKISSLSTFPLPPVVVFRAKSVCVQYKKSYDQWIFSENCYFLLHHVARHNTG